ncbi:crotonase/enoyl-CoA hydratase family protein [Pseudorhodoferax sp.]|uniref:crotonase/enoyl-CoA hydratase family protein n=1 Tax=Pseudorhodoferax sp. TaxID=1993553 RepID=UPI002DD65276|nr:crotonase/enoyl-CoA hydratase family protein [Pseudorhodoferax sp.]
MSSDTPLLAMEQQGPVVLLTLNRAHKRNAINDALLDALAGFFSSPMPDGARVVVLQGSGGHYCAGLDLAERLARPNRGPFERLRHSRRWHRVFEKIQFGELPVISVLQGGVIGGGLELAAATHVRVAERSTFFQLPEGQHGIFVGGGGSVRIPRIVGTGRMVEMMLTGRRLDADEGLAVGLAHQVVEPGEGLGRALALAAQVARNAFLSNYAIVNAIARINDMSAADGLFTESLVASLMASNAEGDERIAGFFAARQDKSR